MKFKVETKELGRTAYVTDELGRVRIEPSEPADFQHAWRIARVPDRERVNRIAPENLD